MQCWLHADVGVRGSSIQGLGLFASAPIPEGTVVSRLGGRLVSSAELRGLVDGSVAGRTRYVDTIVVADDVHLVLPVGTPNHYGNHSCDPNLWWVDAYSLAARRDIGTGEELTTDYAASTGDEQFEMHCSCGSALCRGLVTGSDLKRGDLQVRYEGHWVPALLERMHRGEPPVSRPGL